MHLLREGQFSVAATFLSETDQDKSSQPPAPAPQTDSTSNTAMHIDPQPTPSDEVRNHFSTMYHILHEIEDNKNLLPAIQWSRENRDALDLRGSHLEFQLCQLQYVWLFCGGLDQAGPTLASRQMALDYARNEFHAFMPRYMDEIKHLSGAMAFWPNLHNSPYRHRFDNPSAWNDVAQTFTREFCSLLGLSADSPLYIAATAGAIALPTLLKLQTIMKAKRTEWTSENELPVCIYIPHPGSWKTGRKLTDLGGNTPTTILPIPFHLRLPRIQRTSHRSKPPNDDALRTRYRRRIAQALKQGHQV